MKNTYAENLLDAMQDLFDSMANDRMKLTISGELGEVDAVLEHEDPIADRNIEVAVAYGNQTPADALIEVMRLYAERER